jgi:hypothetical protein
MTTRNLCPICHDPLEASALTVTVAGVAHRVCCEDCARQAKADPSRLS